MRKNGMNLAITTVVLAAFGVFLRWLQNQVSFEAETGLAVRGSIWPYVTALWLVVGAFVLAVQVLRLKNRERVHRPETFREAFAPVSVFEPVAAICFGVLMAAGGAILLVTVPLGEYQRGLLRVLGVLGIVAGIAFPLQLRSSGEAEPGPATAVMAALPMALFAFWLVVSYKIHIVNPTISSYALEIVTICAVIVAFYQMAGFAFGRPKAVRAVFCGTYAAFLCLMSMADSRYAGEQLMFIAAAGMLLLQSWLVTGNIKDAE